MGARADEDGPRLGERLQPRGDVDRVASDKEVAPVACGAGGGDIAGVDADAHVEFRRVPVGGAALGVEVAQGCLHIQRGAHGAHRIVLVRDRQAEDSHHSVADVFLDRAAVAADLACHRGEERGQQRAHVLGVHAIGQLGGAGEIGEEHGDDTALLPALLGERAQGDALLLFRLRRVSVVAVGVGGWRRGDGRGHDPGERCPALVAEARVRWVDRAAIGADTRERLAAVLAEPGVGRVGRLAIRTDHRRVNPSESFTAHG